MKIASILVACAIVVANPRASAQLVSVPAPIGYSDLVGAIRERGDPLEKEGWDGVIAAYATYLDACEALRTGPASEPFHRADEVQLGGTDIDYRREFSERQRRVRPQRGLDEALVAAVIDRLPEQSAGRGPILRAWCLRRWLLQVADGADRTTSRFVPGELRRLAVNDEDRAIIRREVDALEQHMVVLEQRRLDAVPRCAQASADARRGMPPRPSEEDEDAIADWFRMRRALSRAAWRDVRAIERSIDLAVLDCATRLVQQLSRDGRRLVAALEFRTLFDELPTGDVRETLSDAERQLNDPRLPAERRDALREAIGSWRNDDDRAVEELLRLGRRWQQARYDDLIEPLPEGQRVDALEADCGRIGERREVAAGALRDLMAGALAALPDAAPQAAPPLVVEALSAPMTITLDNATIRFAPVLSDSGITLQFEGVSVMDSAVRVVDSSMWVTAPPSISSVLQFGAERHLDADRQRVLEVLHGDLLSEWDERVAPLLLATEHFEQDLHQGAADGAYAARVANQIRQAVATALEVKADFFNHVDALLGEGDHDALATWRLAEMFGSPKQAMDHRAHLPVAEGFGIARRHANLALAVRTTELNDEERATAESAIAARAAALEAADAALTDAEITAHREWLEARLVMADGSQSDRGAAEQQFERTSREIGRRLARAAAARIAVYDEAWRALAEVLSEPTMARLRRTNLRLCHPDVEADRSMYEHAAQRSLDLVEGDLPRGAAVAEAIERWRDDYDAVTDRMAELGIEPQPDAEGRTPTRAVHERISSWLQYRREQAGALYLHTLARLLTEEERRAVGQLPKP